MKEYGNVTENTPKTLSTATRNNQKHRFLIKENPTDVQF